MRPIRTAASPLACIVAATFALALARPARAEMTLRDYQPYAHGVDLPAAVRSYVDGLGAGFVWANAYVSTQNAPPIFCAPGMKPPNEDYVALLNAQISSHAGLSKPYDDDTKLALILLDALINAFPCQSTSP